MPLAIFLTALAVPLRVGYRGGISVVYKGTP